MKVLFYGSFFMLLASYYPVFSQSARIIPIDQPEYVFIEILQKQGLLLDLNPTLWPVSENQLIKAVNNVSESKLSLFQKDLIERIKKTFSTTNGENTLQAYSQISIIDRHNSSERLDPIRPLGTNYAWQSRIEARYTLGNNVWAAQSGITFDRFYDTDPDGIDVVRRLYTRAEESYVNYQNSLVSIRLGRVSEHWGNLSAKGAVLLSHNARSFDHVRFHFGNDKISLTSIVGELDMLGSEGFYQRDRFLDGGIRRFVALHRLDFRPKPNLAISLFEGVLYSGGNAGLSLAYANPVNPFIFVSDNDPKNYENNLQVGMGVWWQFRSWTISGNFMFDDGSYQNRSELKATRQLEPSSWSANMEIYRAALVNNMDIFVRIDAVSSLAYRTDQREGQWTYAQRGLAYNFSDFFEVEIGLKSFVLKDNHNLILEPYVGFLKQGEGDFRFALAARNPDGFGTEPILTGNPSTTTRIATRINYHYGDKLRLSSDIGYNVTNDENHIIGNNTQRFSGLIRIQFLIRKKSLL